jgi:hypothetical protein
VFFKLPGNSGIPDFYKKNTVEIIRPYKKKAKKKKKKNLLQRWLKKAEANEA